MSYRISYKHAKIRPVEHISSPIIKFFLSWCALLSVFESVGFWQFLQRLHCRRTYIRLQYFIFIVCRQSLHFFKTWQIITLSRGQSFWLFSIHWRSRNVLLGAVQVISLLGACSSIILFTVLYMSLLEIYLYTMYTGQSYFICISASGNIKTPFSFVLQLLCLGESCIILLKLMRFFIEKLRANSVTIKHAVKSLSIPSGIKIKNVCN